MITKAALKASAKARKEGGNSFAKLVREGEMAAAAGQPKTSNPYTDDRADACDQSFEI
jgi:hypothetical protein